jgi:DMSO/TMAO reductase YedYZ molybdopterin-dependent catalytic subunit
VAVGTTAGGRWLVARAQQAAGVFARLIGISPRTTPTEEHYVVSKNLFDPSVDEAGWRLRISGLVERPLELGLDDLRAMPSVTRPSTLICVSNPVGGELIGTSEWTGVRLADLLEAAGPRAEARELVLRAADNYTDSFPLDAALREGTIVAYLQNGEPLGSRHGSPARVLVPGIYGMKNVKWVEEIELAEDDYQGYWQTRGWSDEAVVKTMSRIDTDVAVRLDDGRVAVGGVAFAGLRGIRAVEVSLDGGERWLPAEVEPAPNGLSWVRWAAVVEVDEGRFEVRVRATDGEGTVQTAEPSRPLPDGADGHHQRTVRVEA